MQEVLGKITDAMTVAAVAAQFVPGVGTVVGKRAKECSTSLSTQRSEVRQQPVLCIYRIIQVLGLQSSLRDLKFCRH